MPAEEALKNKKSATVKVEDTTRTKCNHRPLPAKEALKNKKSATVKVEDKKLINL